MPVDILVLTQTGDGLPSTSAIVIFSDPSGFTLNTVQVDATGHAASLMPNGGSITVVESVADSAYHVSERLSTIRGVEPGDRIVQGLGRQLSYRAGALSYMQVNYTPPSNMGVPYLFTACADPSSSAPYDGHLTLAFHQSCVAPTFDMLAVGDDTSGIRSFMWRPQNAYADGGSFDLPAVWQPMQQTTTNVSNIPANTSLAVRLYSIVDGTLDEMDRKSFDPVTQSTYTVNLRYGFTAGMRTMLFANTQHGLLNPFTDVTIVTGQSPATIPIDMTAHPLPTLPLSPTQTATGMTWTESGTRGAPDARTELWRGHWTDSASVRHDVAWFFIEPPTLTTVLTLPPLPTAFASHDPTQNGGVTLDGTGLDYIDYDNVPDYAHARVLGTRFVWSEQNFLDVDHAAYRSRSYRN